MRQKFLLVICGLIIAGSTAFSKTTEEINNIRFERKTFNKVTDKADVLLSYPVFTCPEKPLIADSLNNIVNKYMGFLSYSKDNGKYIKREAKDILVEYEKMTDEFTDDLGIKMELIRRVELILNDYGMVSLEYNEYSFTGGAHGNSFQLYTVYDLIGERRVRLPDLFNKGFMPKLTEIGEDYFRALRNHEPTTDLEEAGYWFENNKFALPNNFFISTNGIGFTYNQYEIASYADGIITVLIPFYELKDLISKSSPLRRITSSN